MYILLKKYWNFSLRQQLKMQLNWQQWSMSILCLCFLKISVGNVEFLSITKQKQTKKKSMIENLVAIWGNGPQQRKTTTTKKSPQKLVTKNNKKIH